MRRTSLFAILVWLGVGSFADASEFEHSGQRFRVMVPNGWFVNEQLIAVGGPVSLTSFPPEQWVHGGLLPPNGVAVTVRMVDAPDAESALDTLELHTQKPTRFRRVLGDRQTVGRSSEVRDAEYGEHLLHVAFEVEGKVFLAHLREPVSDGKAPGANTTFTEIVSSIALVSGAEAARP